MSRIMFLREGYGDGNSNPIGCVAIELVDNKTTILPNKDIRYQISVLNPSDKFKRDVARQLAKGRLMEKPIYITLVGKNPSIHEITHQVMTDIAFNNKLPMRARKSAVVWLGYSSLKELTRDKTLH